METKYIKKEMTIIVNEKTYKKYKRELDKIGCKVMQGNFIKEEEWRDIFQY